MDWDNHTQSKIKPPEAGINSREAQKRLHPLDSDLNGISGLYNKASYPS
jgi:uncharacterized lipoprotein YehR (DUF1307 family)